MLLISAVACKNETYLQDHFTTAHQTHQRQLLSSPFSKPVSKKTEYRSVKGGFVYEVKREKTTLSKMPDFFGSSRESIEHDELILIPKKSKKQPKHKGFIGERFRLFNKDPNKKKRKKEGESHPTFSRNRKKAEEKQQPRNQLDLFNNGVLPKMKDTR